MYIFVVTAPVSLDIVTPNAIYFNMPSMENRDVYKALLWVYIAPRSHYDLPNNVSEIFLYRLVPPGKHGGPPVKRFLKKRKRPLSSTSGWHHFDVSDIAHRWASNPSSNLGLVVEAFDAENENLIVMPPTSGIDEGYVSNFR